MRKTGLALLLMAGVPLRRSEAWAPWAALSVTAAVCVPTQYVTLVLKAAAANAQPPIIPTAVILVLVVLGAGAIVVANSASRRKN
jgi:hypothetical protein